MTLLHADSLRSPALRCANLAVLDNFNALVSDNFNALVSSVAGCAASGDRDEHDFATATIGLTVPCWDRIVQIRATDPRFTMLSRTFSTAVAFN